MEEVAQVDALAAQQSAQEAAPVQAVQPGRDHAAVLLRDRAVVGVERIRGRAEDGHVAVEEVAAVVAVGAKPELIG